MRLGIDLRCLPTDGSPGGGIAHAARAVTAELVKGLGDRVILYFPRGAWFEDATNCVMLSDSRRSSLMVALRDRPCDVLFVPSGAVSPGLSVPAIPWIHDCDIFDHPEWFPQSWLKRQVTTQMFLNGIRNAPHVFAVSEYTKKAIERLVPSAKGRITVTGEGGAAVLADIPLSQLAEMKAAARTRVNAHGLHRRYALILGTLEPRKNVPLICRIWSEVAKAAPDVDLVIAGQDGWKTEEIYAAIKAVAPPAIRLKDVSEDMHHDLMLAADLVFVPSFSEGFGLVALEAIQAGTPVLTSNRGALPEVVGTGEWLLDPDSPAAWQDMACRVLKDSSVRDRMVVTQSKKRFAFSWSKTARVIIDQINAKRPA